MFTYQQDMHHFTCFLCRIIEYIDHDFRSPGKEENDEDIHVEISERARKLAEIEKKDSAQQTDNSSLVVQYVDIVRNLYYTA